MDDVYYVVFDLLVALTVANGWPLERAVAWMALRLAQDEKAGCNEPA